MYTRTQETRGASGKHSLKKENLASDPRMEVRSVHNIRCMLVMGNGCISYDHTGHLRGLFGEMVAKLSLAAEGDVFDEI